MFALRKIVLVFASLLTTASVPARSPHVYSLSADNHGRVEAAFTTNSGTAYVMRNETKTGNHWLSLLLVSLKRNRDGIGAVVKLTSTAVPQWVTITTSGGYHSAKDKRVHFGLGAASAARSIQTAWPNGIVQTLNKVHVDRILIVTEPITQGSKP